MTLGLLLYSRSSDFRVCELAFRETGMDSPAVAVVCVCSVGHFPLATHFLGGNTAFWDLFMVDFTTVGLFTGGGALLAACIDTLL
ncbi:MAG: hypothetical protein ACF8AM_13380 [Rhodopirellula sp. JB055]|uniref:hypothetical protein n=1 Tax=Rhodopirellula sp. JB055 TaxID=3342846 RepID=UPI003709E73A